MTFNPERHHRRSIRLRGFDYTREGGYFVTICTRLRECLFGGVVDEQICLNDAGRIVETAWDALPLHYPRVKLDAFVVMPNHVHGIILLIGDPVGAGLKPAPTGHGCTGLKPAPTGHGCTGLKPAPTGHGLGEIVRAFKTFSARCINVTRGAVGVPVWQRNYYEHIIRSDDELQRIRQYIADNPRQWACKHDNPSYMSAPAKDPLRCNYENAHESSTGL